MSQRQFNHMIYELAENRVDEITEVYGKLVKGCNGFENLISFLAAVELVASLIESAPENLRQQIGISAITVIGQATGGQVHIAEKETGH